MTVTEITVVHVRKCKVILKKTELENIVMDYALKKAGFIEYATSAEISFPDATAGSPPYKVGTECIISLTEDQSKFPQVEPK